MEAFSTAETGPQVQTRLAGRFFFKATELRFKAMELRFKATELRFKAMELRFKAGELRFKATELRFKATELRFKATELRFKAREFRDRAGRRLCKWAEEGGTGPSGRRHRRPHNRLVSTPRPPPHGHKASHEEGERPPDQARGQICSTADDSDAIVFFALPKTMIVFGKRKSSLSMPAKPGFIERLLTMTVRHLSTSRIGMP